MATVSLSVSRAKSWGDAWVASWALSDADDGSPCEMIMASEKSVQVEGTFAGATVVLQGSNDGVNWRTLNDPNVAPLSFAAAGLKAVLEHTRYIRPLSSGGVGAAITVTVFMRGQSV